MALLMLPTNTGTDHCSLQEAFLNYRKKKQNELLQKRCQQQTAMAGRSDPTRMAILRKKFIDTAKTYIGVPYARKYHQPDSPTYHSPLFLDCCGLVRQILRDLKEDFGFNIGPWNQAYQFDTLPSALSVPSDMQPGDLVFISAVYYNPKARQQRHHMVHVEIWLGEGERTLGARWQRGSVEIHESYQFVSKSYHHMQYHFRSIDTWLTGICQSFCPEHPWQKHTFQPGRYSVFALEEASDLDQQAEEEEEEEGGCGGEEQEGGCGGEAGDAVEVPVGGGAVKHGSQSQGGAKGSSHKAQCTSPPSISTGPRSPKKSLQLRPLKSVHSTRTSAGRGTRTFIICGGNAAPLVERAMVVRGWEKLEDKSSSAFTLKWVELKQHIDYKNFREGEQLVNHFPNVDLLTTKIGLLESLRAHERLHQIAHRPQLRLERVLPLTYRMDVPAEREEFFRSYTDGDLWICKPTGANQGKGIFLVRELQQLVDKLESDERTCKVTSRPTARIVQKYICNPLLLEGRKFDIRVYLLIVAARPFLALYHAGYIRLSCEPYSESSTSACVHLTNQYQQKKHPLYQQVKEDTVWDFAKFQSYLTAQYSLPADWVDTTLTKRIQAIMTLCFESVRHKLTHKLGFFDLLGFDFMVDTDFNVWLIEVNVNPAMHTNCDTLSSIVPPVIEETLDLAIEVFDKCRRSKPMLPLTSLRSFVPLVT